MKSIRHHQQQQKLQHNIMRAQQGHTQVEGGTLYLFENHRNHDLSLPRKSFDGKTLIPPRGRFRGDSYFLMMLQTGFCRLISSEPYIKEGPKPPEIVSQQEVQETVAVKVETKVEAPTNLNENIVKESTVEKLILDQPERVTRQGQTEQFVRPENSLKEINMENNVKGKEFLLTENPLDGVDIING